MTREEPRLKAFSDLRQGLLHTPDPSAENSAQGKLLESLSSEISWPYGTKATAGVTAVGVVRYQARTHASV